MKKALVLLAISAILLTILNSCRTREHCPAYGNHGRVIIEKVEKAS